MKPLGIAGGVFSAALLCSQVAPAAPQWQGAAQSGACITTLSGAKDLVWCNGVSGHVLFGRERDKDFGLGPYARLTSPWGLPVTGGLGASALLPLSATYPFILSLGGTLSRVRGAATPGIEAWLFWGPSSYNFHSSYSMASGLLAGVQRNWAEGRDATTFSLLAQIDLALVAIPLIAAFELIRGSPEP